MKYDYIGERVRTAREARNWTRPMLSDATGLHIQTIAELELGITKQTSAETVLRIAHALGIMAGDLLQPPAKRKRRKK